MTEFYEFKWEEMLRNDEEMAAFLEATIEENDPLALQSAIGIVARIKGMNEIAEETGLNEKSLYRAFSEKGNPTLSTLTKVLDALNMKIKIVPKDEPKGESEEQAA